MAEAVRALVEETELGQRLIAARLGLTQATVWRLAALHGWSGPAGAARSRNGCGRPYREETIAAARELIEGTDLPQSTVATRIGVSTTTLCRWCKRWGWRRPGAETVRARPVRYRRGRGRPYAADAVGTARDLLVGTLLSQKTIAARAGVSQPQVSVWLRRRGWVRPAAPARRFAASRRTGPTVGPEEGVDRRGRRYAAGTVAEARLLYEETGLSTRIIGARVGAHPVTIARWAREKAWACERLDHDRRGRIVTRRRPQRGG